MDVELSPHVTFSAPTTASASVSPRTLAEDVSTQARHPTQPDLQASKAEIDDDLFAASDFNEDWD